MTRTQATTVGFCAVLLWSLLALLTISTGPVPPFQLNAMCFAIATGVGLVWAARTGGVMQVVRLSWKTCAFGTLGLFGFHFFYFSATAPCANGRDRADRLSLAAADRPVFGASAR